MRDEEHREVRVVPELQELVLHLAPRQRVERRERLVHQQDVGLHRHPARDRHPLLHAARERVRQAVGELGEVHLRDRVPRLVPRGRAREAAARHQRKHHVLGHRLPGQQLVEFLEHHHAIRSGPRHDLALQPDLALDRAHVSADRLQQRRLAATRRPEQDEAIRPEDFEVDAIRRRDEMVPRLVLQRDAADIEQRRRPPGMPVIGLLRLPGQAIEIDVAAREDHADRRAPTSRLSSRRHASGTADEGSMMIFIRSQVIRIARTMASSDAVPTAVTRCRMAASVRGDSVVRSPSAIVVVGASGSTDPVRKLARGVVGVRGLRAVDADRRLERARGNGRARQESASAHRRDHDVEVRASTPGARRPPWPDRR